MKRHPDGRLRLSCDAIVFDCDGVLVYSRPAVEAAWRQLCLEFSLDAAAVLPTIHGVRSVDTLAAWLPKSTARMAERRLEDLEVATAGDVEAVSGAAALTALLPFDRWGVATSGARRLAIARLEAAGIVVPAVLVGGGDVPRGKPFPDPYLRAAAALGVDPARTVVFEDTPALAGGSIELTIPSG